MNEVVKSELINGFVFFLINYVKSVVFIDDYVVNYLFNFFSFISIGERNVFGLIWKILIYVRILIFFFGY